MPPEGSAEKEAQVDAAGKLSTELTGDGKL